MKFKHMSDKEIIQHIENQGTDEEKELMKRFYVEQDWSDCPECVLLNLDLETAEIKIDNARVALE